MMVSNFLDEYRPLIEQSLSDACDFENSAGGAMKCPDKLREAIRYALLAPGKRLRPSLVLMSAQACGGTIANAMPGAIAVEMIHAYSLIHDDLPAMDDDDLRRGRPTTHIQFGEATAILAGDALQAEAFAHLYRCVGDRIQAAHMIGELAQAAGASGLVGGQEDDLAAETVSIEDFASPRAAREHVESIHRRKTGALFVASVRLGAISAGVGNEIIDALGRYAEAFGLAFQITDDVLDYTATDEQLGKRTQKDVGRGKLTFPELMAAEANARDEQGNLDVSVGIEKARQHAAAMIQQAHDALGVLSSLEISGASAGQLHTMADYILERTT